jgi:hypothetical protein
MDGFITTTAVRYAAADTGSTPVLATRTSQLGSLFFFKVMHGFISAAADGQVRCGRHGSNSFFAATDLINGSIVIFYPFTFLLKSIQG